MLGPHSRLWLLAAACCLPVTVGCNDGEMEFESNRVHAMALERSRDLPTDAALADVELVLAKLFGTPEEPAWPADRLTVDQRELVSLERLQQASGSVESDAENVHRGLYTEHCVICHGISGSGTGPASMYQWPYPRDFRAGVFKWKSTQRDAKPTRDDLRRLLENGIPGTPMPSFMTVTPSDREALIDYLIYLSIRGEVERQLLALAIDDLGYEDTPPTEDLRLRVTTTENANSGRNEAGEIVFTDLTQSSRDAKPPPAPDEGNQPEPTAVEPTEGELAVEEILQAVASEWVQPQAPPVPPEQIPHAADELHASIARGAKLFSGQVTNCAGCHGPAGQGGLPLNDLDDWTKEFTTRIGITPTDADAVKPFRQAGALPPRIIEPRRLAGGVLRGGDDPETIFRRIQHGIAGTPMPGIELSESATSGTGLTPGDVWDLVHYVQSLVQPTPKPSVRVVDDKNSSAAAKTGVSL
ncbi:cytochrome c [Rhodopirellula sp. P2]|uniref:cytochrome c n=1 Tax=Rhodopirellula sp. P2 TaxID=2127060 RepID=UPI002368B689|nr:cytochrome c [Rhodopirellula sp. P2]WDQ16904.1 cytochrome c [Rhodopirellula sp. P2]